MGKKSLQTLGEKFSNLWKITTLTTDRYVQIRTFLKRNFLKYYISLMYGNLESHSKKLCLELQKKETINKWVYGLR